MQEIALMLKAIYAHENKEAVIQKTRDVIEKLKKMKLTKAMRLMEKHIRETFTFYQFPKMHWRLSIHPISLLINLTKNE